MPNRLIQMIHYMNFLVHFFIPFLRHIDHIRQMKMVKKLNAEALEETVCITRMDFPCHVFGTFDLGSSSS